MKTNKIYIGIDVASTHLDVYQAAQQELSKVSNDRDSIESFLECLRGHRQSIRLVCETTGGYESTIVQLASKLGMADSCGSPIVPRLAPMRLERGTITPSRRALAPGSLP